MARKRYSIDEYTQYIDRDIDFRLTSNYVHKQIVGVGNVAIDSVDYVKMEGWELELETYANHSDIMVRLTLRGDSSSNAANTIIRSKIDGYFNDTGLRSSAADTYQRPPLLFVNTLTSGSDSQTHGFEILHNVSKGLHRIELWAACSAASFDIDTDTAPIEICAVEVPVVLAKDVLP